MKFSWLPVEAVETAAFGADPQVAVGVLGDGPDVRIAQAVGIVGVGFVGDDLAAIVTVQAVLRAHPDESAAVLEVGNDGTLGQSVGQHQPVELDGHFRVGGMPARTHKTVQMKTTQMARRYFRFMEKISGTLAQMGAPGWKPLASHVIANMSRT